MRCYLLIQLSFGLTQSFLLVRVGCCWLMQQVLCVRRSARKSDPWQRPAAARKNQIKGGVFPGEIKFPVRRRVRSSAEEKNAADCIVVDLILH